MPPADYRFQKDRPKKGIVVDWSISIGQIGSAILVMLSVVIAYEKLESRTTNNDTSISELKENVKTLNTTLTDTNLAVRELRVTVQWEGTKTRANTDSQNQK